MTKCKLCKSAETKFFHKKNHYKYYLCDRCRTLFLHPLPSQKKLNDYYRKNFKYTAGEANEKNIRSRAKIILKNFKKLNPGGKSLFDIGSGYGYFLQEALKAGFETLGIEPSQSIRSTSINQHVLSEIEGLIEVKIKKTNFEQFYAKNNKKRFDFITIIHTIEHVTNPRSLIINASKLLNPNGILYIETPNLDSHLFRAEKQNYTFLTPPDHVWIFSRRSFQVILNKTPELYISNISSSSSPEHLMGIIKMKLENRNSELEINKKRFNPKKIIIPNQKSKYPISNIKYLLFDKLIAPVFTPFLNLGIYGSILELYIRKK